jgi:hypothetical protein
LRSSYGIEDCLTLSEAAEDQHCFGGSGVDNIADLFVVEQEIDELGDVDVVYGDVGGITSRHHQVLLLGPIQFQIPRGYPVDATAGKISTRKACVPQARAAEVRAAEARSN